MADTDWSAQETERVIDLLRSAVDRNEARDCLASMLRVALAQGKADGVSQAFDRMGEVIDEVTAAPNVSEHGHA